MTSIQNFRPTPPTPPADPAGTKLGDKLSDLGDKLGGKHPGAGARTDAIKEKLVPKPPKPPHDDAKDKRRPGAMGPEIPIEVQGAMLVNAYDSNGDGGIGVATESSKFIGDKTSGRTVSVERLARVADNQGYVDGVASQEELEAVIQQYDVGATVSDQLRNQGELPVAGDGLLSGSEYQRFLKDFGPVQSPSFLDIFRSSKELATS